VDGTDNSLALGSKVFQCLKELCFNHFDITFEKEVERMNPLGQYFEP